MTKKGKVPGTKIKTRSLTASQKKLWKLIGQDVQIVQQAMQQMLQVIQNSLVNPYLVSTLERFAGELGLDVDEDNLDFDHEKLQFKIMPPTPKVKKDEISK